MRLVDFVVSLRLKRLQRKILDNRIKAKRKPLSKEERILGTYLNQVVESGQYDVSPLEMSMKDVRQFTDHHRTSIRGMALLAFYGAIARPFVARDVVEAFDAEMKQPKTGGPVLYGSNELESEHSRVSWERMNAEDAEARKTLTTADISNHFEAQQAAIKNGTLGPIYYLTDGYSLNLPSGYGIPFLAWFKQQGPDYWQVAAECTTNCGEDADLWMASQPSCDRATAAVLYKMYFESWGADFYLSQKRKGIEAEKAGQTLSSYDRKPKPFEVIGRNWNAGFYTSKRFGWDFDLWILDYRKHYEQIRDSEIESDWLIHPDDLEATDGAMPDCPFYFGDQCAYFKSDDIAEQFFDADAQSRALRDWLAESQDEFAAT